MYHLKALYALRGYTPKLHLKGSQGEEGGGRGGGRAGKGEDGVGRKQRKEDEEVRASESVKAAGGGGGWADSFETFCYCSQMWEPVNAPSSIMTGKVGGDVGTRETR